MDKEQKEQDKKVLVHEFFQTERLFSTKLVAFLAVVALLGIGTGYLLSKSNIKAGPINISRSGEDVEKGTVVGSNDTKTFRDSAQGQLEKGGIEDEGQYHLVRPGGESQYVYLTSSVIDLSKFIGKKVKVWGETQKGKKAGWLMDVGKVEVL